METVIRFDRVSKSYRLSQQQPFLLKELWRLVLQKPSSIGQHEALHDISFEVKAGEALGVMGHNGAGKSTLLSLIARTSYPTSGTVDVQGRVGPLLELGAGFHPDLTGYENVYLNAALLGLSREEVDARLDSILDFAEIGEFIHSPIQTYSTGMLARLGFAVVAHVDADILLLDEVLAVGDERFQNKCVRAIRKFKDEGSTLFFVSHNLSSLVELCDRTLWIDSGRIRAEGPPAEIAAEYQEYMRSTPTQPAQA